MTVPPPSLFAHTEFQFHTRLLAVLPYKEKRKQCIGEAAAWFQYHTPTQMKVSLLTSYMTQGIPSKSRGLLFPGTQAFQRHYYLRGLTWLG